MRTGAMWAAIIGAALVLLTLVVVIVGSDDNSRKTVSASEWVDGVCGAVGVWRSELRSIVKDVRLAPAFGGTTDEPQSEVKRGRTGALRQGLEQAVRATETMVTGVENAGTPDTPDGDQVAQAVSDWADDSLDSLEDAQDALESDPSDLQDAIEGLGDVAQAFGETLAKGTATIAEVIRLDPQIATAAASSTTCRQMNEEEDSA